MPGVQDLVDVLVALRVARAGRVRVRQLVDQGELRRASHDLVDVHLLERHAAVLDAAARHRLEPLGERRRLRPIVRLEVADHDVDALGLRLPALEQHAVGLADAGGRAEEDPVAAAHASDAYAPSRLCTMRSISLMPMNGAMMPPRP